MALHSRIPSRLGLVWAAHPDFMFVHPHILILCLFTLTIPSTATLVFDGFAALLLLCFDFYRAIRLCCTDSRAPKLEPKSRPVRFQHPTGFVFGARTGIERRIKRPSTNMPYRRDSERWSWRNLRRTRQKSAGLDWPAVTDSTII